jgi:hypothetical protein
MEIKSTNKPKTLINNFNILGEYKNKYSTEKSVENNYNSGSIQTLYTYYLYYYLTSKEFLPGGSATAIRHNKQITCITQNNTPRSNKAQHVRLLQIEFILNHSYYS